MISPAASSPPFRRALVLLGLSLPSSLLAAEAGDEFAQYSVDRRQAVQTAPEAAREQWRHDRFGMFIHWGPISQLGKQLSHSRNSPSHRPGGKPYKVAAIPPEVYDVQYRTFNPVKYDPDAIVQLAQRVGMRYLVFTAKHHAGFSMFDSAVTDYDIMSAPYGRDILKELEQACRRHDFNFGFYYSPRDWRHPDCDSEQHHDRYIKFYQAQMEELLTRYGRIYAIFFDGLGPGPWGNTATEVMTRIREIQPNALVNDRGGAGADFYTPEHTVSHFNRKQLWEACHTTTGQWGYNPDVKAKSFPELMEILLYTWGADGNMLLNIGPRGDGSVNPDEAQVLEQVAGWWAGHGEASIRGSRGGPYFPAPWGVSTCKGNRVFLHVLRWPANDTLSVPALPGRKLLGASILSGGEIATMPAAGAWTFRVPANARRPVVTTLQLQLDGDAVQVDPLPAQRSLTWAAHLTSSQDGGNIGRVVDGDATTMWEANGTRGEIWIEARWDHAVEIGSVVTGRGDKWSPRHDPELQVPDGRGGWKTAFAWKAKFAPVTFLDTVLKTDRVRLLIKNCARYDLAEFELYPPTP